MRRSLVVIVVIGLSCVCAGCGLGTSADASTTSASATRFTPAGYQALRAYLRLGYRLHNEAGLTLAKIERMRPLCRHLGPNSVDLEVQGIRSGCAGALTVTGALAEIRVCDTLVDSAQRPCVVKALQLFASGEEQVVAAENGILQILGNGPCYTFMNKGVPQDRRLLAVTNQLVAALDSDSATRQLLNSWQHALNVDLGTEPSLAAEAKRAKACQPV